MQKEKLERLRQKAEEIAGQTAPRQQTDAKEFIELAHELQVHQIELDLQNEELRETQARLEESNNKYFELYEFAPVGYMSMDDHGVIATVNLHMVKMFGIPRGRLLGRTFGGFVDPMFQDAFFTHLRGVLGDTKSHSCELAITKPDQTKLFIQIESSYAGQNRAGKKNIRSVIIDITELNQTRHEIDVLNRELEKKVAERTAVAEVRLNQLKTLNFELIRAEQRERRRLAELLHDNLQQLLVGCQFNISFLRKGRYDKKQSDILDRTSGILKDAIGLSRTLAFELCPPVLYQGGLPAALEWLKDQKKTLHNFNVHLDIDPNIPRLPIDIETFFFQCAKELLLNAVKHSKTTEADIALQFSEDKLTLCVSDKGTGCDPVTLQDSPKIKKGFGLFNIKNRIETMAGSFEARSTRKGFTVTLTLPVSDLPVSDLPVGAEKPKRPTAEKKPLPRTKKASIKVMVVDDHRILRKGICRLLEMEKDIEVVAEAKDGLQAVEKARSHKPQVILMDIGLPVMDGIEATVKIIHENHNIRVIALSLHESEGYVNRMMEAGASRYLTKNVPVEELVQAIRAEAATALIQTTDSSV